MEDRTGCCADWPKPCSYHEGYQDALSAINEQPYNGEHVKELEKALIDLGNASATLRDYIDEEHFHAMERAWEAGEAKLTEVTEAVWPTT